MPIADDVVLGRDVTLASPELVSLHGCWIGDGTHIGVFVAIQKNAVVGARCQISSHSFICEGVRIEDEVFIGNGVVFTNDLYPRACTKSGEIKTGLQWSVIETRVARGASIGSNATIIAGVEIGERAMVGAGAVVTKDVRPGTIVAGAPAVVIGAMTA